MLSRLIGTCTRLVARGYQLTRMHWVLGPPLPVDRFAICASHNLSTPNFADVLHQHSPLLLLNSIWNLIPVG